MACETGSGSDSRAGLASGLLTFLRADISLFRPLSCFRSWSRSYRAAGDQAQGLDLTELRVIRFRVWIIPSCRGSGSGFRALRVDGCGHGRPAPILELPCCAAGCDRQAAVKKSPHMQRQPAGCWGHGWVTAGVCTGGPAPKVRHLIVGAGHIVHTGPRWEQATLSVLAQGGT